MQIYQFDVFTTIEGEGNPAGVVAAADKLNEALFGEIARQTMLETAFILQPRDAQNGLRLRYFAPNGDEMNLCAHASIAALFLLSSQGRLKGRCTLETNAGLLRAEIEPGDAESQRIWLELPAPRFDTGPFPLDQIAATLGLAADRLTATGWPIVAAATGRAKLLIPLCDYLTLDKIEIDRVTLDELCRQYQLTGLYPFTLQPRNPGVDAEARQFPYNLGFEEDPVTGVAMAALGAYLVQYKIRPQARFMIEQGHALNCPGRAEVRVQSVADGGAIESVRIGGQAVFVDSTTFEG